VAQAEGIGGGGDIVLNRAYWQLTKPTIVLLIVVTSIPSVLMAFAGNFELGVFVGALLGTVLAAASASVLNHVFEAHLDRRMTRTRQRPLAARRVSRGRAVLFALSLGLAALAVLAWGTTVLAALLALSGIAFYALFYTLVLKPTTPQNIVIGGAAGAVGPLIGWAAVTGNLSWSAWLLFLVIFLWTPPHFWALAIHYCEDYRRASVPMYPVVHGVRKTQNLIVIYVIALLPVLVGLYAVSECSPLFFIASLALTLWFLVQAVLLRVGRGSEMALFRFSCYYILLLFGGLAIDQLVVHWS